MPCTRLPGWLSANGPGAVRPGCEASVVCAVKSAARFPGPRRKGLRSSLSVLSIHILAPMRGFSEAAVQILEWGWEAGAAL